MEPQRLSELVRAGETDLLELKREWWDLDSKVGKATFAKDILAMANALAPGESGFIVVGVEDKKVGGTIVGVIRTPPQETVAQILGAHTNPVPRIKLGETSLDDKKLSVLEIIWGESHPYYATRDVETVLSSDVVYIRRAGTVGRLKPAELERLIRAKDTRMGKITDAAPLSVGFVELPRLGASDRFSFRVANITEEPVTNVSASVDITHIGHRKSSLCRMPQLSELPMRPGETREIEFQLSNASFYDEEQGRFVHYQTVDSTQGFDIRLRVRYRDRDGFLYEIIREASTCR